MFDDVVGRRLGRRQLLRAVAATAGLLGVVPLMAACGGAAGSPAAATAAAQAAAAQSAVRASATTAAAAPTTAPAAAPSPAATTAAQAQPAAAAGGKIPLSITVRTEPNNEWIKHWAQVWQQRHPEVALTIVDIPYGDMAKKQLAELATDTMQDVVYSGIKWFNYSAIKGAFRPIDDYVKTMDPGMDDFLADAIAGCTIDGKLYALPSEVNTGNSDIIIFNIDHLQKKGLQPPTDDWTVQQFVDAATKANDPSAKVFGTNYYPGTYYDFDALARTWGGEVFSADAKQFTLATDPKSVEAAQWAVDLRTKYKIAPNQQESQGLTFPAGQVAYSATGIYVVLSVGKTVGDKFKWDVVLFPKGPTGLRGYESFVVMWSVYAKSKHPEQAYDLVVNETSKETGIWAVVNDLYEPNARKSVWGAPEVTKINPIFGRALAWITDGKNKGPFPMPYNARFSELEDKYENVSPALWYGQVAFADGIKKVQQECQAIMDLPRP